MDLSVDAAARALGVGYFNLIKRGTDGSLVLSSDRWRAEEPTGEALRFAAQAPEAPPLELAREDIARAAWDRLPKQHARSQVRFYLRSGDLWTFSGSVDEDALRT